MEDAKNFEIIIVGGSYAGLSAALALGRSLRKVLIIDNGEPCNSQTPYSHNFLTQDGKPPAEISKVARLQVEAYPSIHFHQDLAVRGKKMAAGFVIETQSGNVFSTEKLIFATGLKDHSSGIPGFSECWGISVLHCPYCHGYEVRRQKTAIIANADIAYHYAMLISHWTDDLVLCTNGPGLLNSEQKQKIEHHGINIVEKKIVMLEHEKGQVSQISFADQSSVAIDAIYSSPGFEQHCQIPAQLGCDINEEGLISVDNFQKTSVEGIYACGDNSNLRSVSLAVSSGSVAGMVCNKDMIAAKF
ncbi:MAG: NAD(P)/FAD-dependent oxidoreductase [Reichenbachiella sp.]|uniref:NAD(P)/FAD-dependent oxidoreductase n=1 Tax=Reichenbachiella sp. TaxID=2184521 RepID=UPI00326480D1